MGNIYDNEKKLLNTLPVINSILSLFIIIHHSFVQNVDFNGSYNPLIYGFSVALQRFLYNLSECAVPIFFFLSAYLFYRNYDGSAEAYKYKIKRRFYSLFIPYIIFCTLGYIKHLVATGNLMGGILDWLKELYLCETMPLWFIRELLFLSILAPIVFYVKNRKWMTSFLAIFIIILIIFGFVRYRSFIYWLPIYLLGASVKKNIWSIIAGKLKKCGVWLLFLSVALMIMSWFLPNTTSVMGYWGNFLFIIFRICIVPVFLTLALFVSLNKEFKIRKWMNYSFFVFCIHFPVISLLKISYDKIVVDVIPPPIVKVFYNNIFNLFLLHPNRIYFGNFFLKSMEGREW